MVAVKEVGSLVPLSPPLPAPLQHHDAAADSSCPISAIKGVNCSSQRVSAATVGRPCASRVFERSCREGGGFLVTVTASVSGLLLPPDSGTPSSAPRALLFKTSFCAFCVLSRSRAR